MDHFYSLCHHNFIMSSYEFECHKKDQQTYKYHDVTEIKDGYFACAHQSQMRHEQGLHDSGSESLFLIPCSHIACRVAFYNPVSAPEVFLHVQQVARTRHKLHIVSKF